MSVPQTSASKGKVMMKEYDGLHFETEHIFRWMTLHVAQRIKTLRQPSQLTEEWCPDQDHPVKMFLFAHLSQPPAFFSSLSVKFTGRIEFIFVDIRQWNNYSTLSEIGVKTSPAYILMMPEGIYQYGNSTGEFLSLAAMDTFLRSVQPEVNDLFVLSLVLVNLLSWMDLFITQGATVKRFVVLIRTLGTYNSLLLVSWLPVLALLQWQYLENVYAYSLKLLRYIDTTSLASLIRADWIFYSSHPALFLSTYLAHGLLVDYVEKKRCPSMTEGESSTNLQWLTSLWDWYTSCLFHPIVSLHQVPVDQSDWDDSNFMMQRMAFPDLWLHPLVNVDYIQSLPIWNFITIHKQSSKELREERTGSAKNDAKQINNTCQCGCDNLTATYCQENGPSGSTPRKCQNGLNLKLLCVPYQQCDWSLWPQGTIHCLECVVCLENFACKELLMSLPCGHAFHQQCIVVWLMGSRHCCPVCRWPSYKNKPLIKTGVGQNN